MKWLLIGYACMSLVTLVAYGLDKRRAARGTWRTAEMTLHLLALAGGWPGALAGQQLFRHKTRKIRFQVVTWAIVGVHVASWTWWWLGRPGG